MTKLHGPLIILFGIAVALVGGVLCRSVRPAPRILLSLGSTSSQPGHGGALVCPCWLHVGADDVNCTHVTLPLYG